MLQAEVGKTIGVSGKPNEIICRSDLPFRLLDLKELLKHGNFFWDVGKEMAGIGAQSHRVIEDEPLRFAVS